MARRKNNKVNPYVLSLMGSALLAAGFLMGPFPVLIFAGLAPLFALVDYAEGDFFWNKLELVAVALFVGFFGAHAFSSQLVPAIFQAIGVTLGFAAFTFTRQALGARLGRMPLIFFLLALEYVALKTGLGSAAVFLADALRFKADWVRWTAETGYLGISLWILMANHVLYVALFRAGISIGWLVVFLIVVCGPIIYSFSLSGPGIDREMMLMAYRPGQGEMAGEYSVGGEWVSRTAAWISALVLVFAFVKSYIQKK
jgi:hypothetical protein